MSEQTHQPPLSPIDSLQQVMGLGEHATPATMEDFNELGQLLDGVVSEHRDHASNGDYRFTGSSEFLRQEGEPSTAPRVRVTTDPSGERHRGTNFLGRPTLSVAIEQGRRSKAYSNSDPRGSWVMGVDIIRGEHGELLTTSQGSIARGGARRESLGFTSPMTAKPVSRELIEWVKGQLGDPETLVPAPTRREKIANRLGKIVGIH